MGRYVCIFLYPSTPLFPTLVFCLGALSSIYKYIYLYTKAYDIIIQQAQTQRGGQPSYRPAHPLQKGE